MGVNYFQIYSTETQSRRDRVRMCLHRCPPIVGEKEEDVVYNRLTVHGEHTLTGFCTTDRAGEHTSPPTETRI